MEETLLSKTLALPIFASDPLSSVAYATEAALVVLVAASALLVDYILTVAVSVAAGVLALTSAVPSLEGHRVETSLLFIAGLTLVNLRGVREAGLLFAVPTHAFVAAMFAMIATGIGQCAIGACPQGLSEIARCGVTGDSFSQIISRLVGCVRSTRSRDDVCGRPPRSRRCWPLLR